MRFRIFVVVRRYFDNEGLLKFFILLELLLELIVGKECWVVKLLLGESIIEESFYDKWVVKWMILICFIWFKIVVFVVFVLISGRLVKSFFIILVLYLELGIFLKYYFWLIDIGIFGFLIIIVLEELIIGRLWRLRFWLLVRVVTDGMMFKLKRLNMYFWFCFFRSIGKGMRYSFFCKIRIRLMGLFFYFVDIVAMVFFIGVINIWYNIERGVLVEVWDFMRRLDFLCMLKLLVVKLVDRLNILFRL